MKTMRTIHLWKGLLNCGTLRRRLTALVFCLATVTVMHAAPVVSDNDGYFFDDYGDYLGVFSASQVKVTGGTVSLITPNTTGNYRTVEIVPTSFDQWGQLTIVGTYGALGDLTAEVRSQDGLTVLIPAQPVNSPINLSSLNPITVPGIRVQVYFNKTAVVAPTLDSLLVTWRPVSQLLLDKQGPVQVQAGENIVYRVRYSVNYVRAQDLVIWDTLPQYPGSLTYPTEISPTPYPGQNDNLTFVSATKGGLYNPGPAAIVVAGVTVPPNSVYWNLGNVAEGTTDLLNFTLATRNGTLDMTTVANQAHVDAANAAPSQSQTVVTTIRSTPAPSLIKGGGAGIYNIGGVAQTIPGTINSFSITAGNGSGLGRETMYNTVVYDDLSGLLNVIADLGAPGLSAEDLFNISPAGGTFNPAYDPDGAGSLPAIPAIVWNVGTLEPGGNFSGSFSVQLLASPPQTEYINRACVTSDQTSPICRQFVVKIGIDQTPGSTFTKSAPTQVPYGGSAVFGLTAANSSAVKLNDLVLLDMVPPNTTFNTAWFNDPNLFLSGARIFYSTSVLFPDPNIPPPVDYTQAPADLDVSPNAYWERYDLIPLVMPAAVTWVAFYIPQLDSVHLPNNRTPALPPSTPITSAAGFFDVNVFAAVNPCIDAALFNRGLFQANESTDLSGVKAPIAGGPLNSISDRHVTVTGVKARLSAGSGITPVLVEVPGNSTYSLTVANNGSDALANVQVVVQLSQISVNGVLEYPSVQGISPAGTYNPLSGQVTFALGLMPVGTSRSIQIELSFPAGILDGTQYSLSAAATGQGVLCGPATATSIARGQIDSSPKLRVFKRDVVDLITSGADYDYELEYINLGTAPSTGTFVVDRVPKKTVLVRAYGNANLTRVWFSGVDNLPPQVLTPFTPIDGSAIATYFSAGTLNDNGTPGVPADDYWTSPFGALTYWIAWEVDDPILSPPQFIPNMPRTVGFTARNDDDAQGAGTIGSPEGTQLFNTVGIFSSELLQAIGNQVITTIKGQPSIIVQKSGPSVLEAGVQFNWVVNYYNNSQTPADTVTITDTLPPGITFVSATHIWNPVALANGAPVGNNGQLVPTTVVNNPDGSTTLTFIIAGAVGYRGNGVQLASLEGGTLTLAVQSDPATPSGTARINVVCGTADTAGESLTSCDDHQVTIFRPDLQLLKFASPVTVLAGGTLTYQLVLANRGPINARDVTLTDILPAGVSYVPASISVLTPGYTLGAPAISGQTLTWSVADGNALTRTGLPAGEVPGNSGNIVIQFSVQVGGGVPGCTTLDNVAQVSTVSAEEGVYPNAANAIATVPPPELAVAKTGPALARPGNRVTWNLIWVNQSPQAAAGVYLVDTLPNTDADPNSDVTFVSVTTPAGVTAYYHAGPVASAPAFDPNNPLTGGWSATPTTPVNHIALLVGTLAGNAGPFTAQVTVDLIDPNGGIPVLPPPGTCFANTLEIRQAVPLCENPADNTAVATVCTPALDLALTKTGSVQGALPGIVPGQPITYTLAFENSGTVRAYGVRVTDVIPVALLPDSPLDNFTVVTLVDENGNAVSPVDQLGDLIVGAVPVTRSISGNTVTWYLGTTTPSDALYYQKVGLPPGSRGSFQVRVIVAESVLDGTEVCNPANVAADVGLEELLANNSSQSCVTVRRPDLAVRKSGVDVLTGDPDFAEFGGLILYNIEYNNLGSIGAQNVVIDEIVPTGTSLVSVNPPPGATVTYSPNQANATSFSVRFDTLPAPANSVGATASATTNIVGCTETNNSFVTPTNCCNNCFTNIVSQSVTVYPGDNYLVVPLCLTTSNNLLNTILPGMPNGLEFFKWNWPGQFFNQASTYFDFGDPSFNGWYDQSFNLSTETLVLGEGFVLRNPGPPFTITFTGCLPTCTPACGPLPGFSLVGKLGLGTATYAELFSCAPVCGTQLRVWSPTNQVFNDFNYVNGAWLPQEPLVPAGASAFVAVLENTNCLPCAPTTNITAGCLGVNSNGVYEAFALANPSGFLGWGTLFVDDIIPNGANITYSVGRVVSGMAVYDLGPLYTSVSVGPNGLDLSGINPAYTDLVLRAEPFALTTATTNVTTTGNTPTPPSTNIVDTVPPTVLAVACIGTSNQILVTFSEGMDPGPASEPSNYFLDGGPNIISALLQPDGQSVVLNLDSSMTENTLYTLMVFFVADLSGNFLLDATISFQSCITTLSPCLRGWQMTYNSANWPSFTFTVLVDGRGADSCGPLPIGNAVAISTTTPEITLANNTASYAMNTRLTDLRVEMGVNVAAALETETLTYTLDWLVVGPQSAPNAYLQVVLADGDGDGLSDVTLATVTPGAGVTVYYHTDSTLTPPIFDPNNPLANGWTTSTIGANHIAFLLGNPAPSTAGNISWTATVNSGTAGQTLVSTVAGHTSRRETDCDNSGSVLTFVGNLANVFVQKTGPGCVHPGNLVTFTIAYGNNGNAPAANLVVADALPAGLTFISAVPAPTGPGLSWNNLGAVPGTLAALETGVITVVAQLDNNYALIGQTLANLATISTSSGEVNLGDNQALAVLDCITVDLVSLSGYVYHDRNNNGLREFGAGETGIPNVIITLTGTDVFGSAVTLSDLTDPDGQYNFSGLNPGTYTVTETQPATWASTADTIGTVGGSPQGNNTNPLDDVLGTITLNGGDNGVEYNFGENYLSLGNLVWRDDDNDGQQDVGEPGISGVTVQLWSPGVNGVVGGGDDQLLASTTTSGSGLYQFTHLLPGNYYVLIPVNNFTAGGSLLNLPLSSTPTTLTDTGAAGPDSRDAGTQPGGTGTETVSPVVNLALGQEAPAGVDGDDFNGMLTLDFGFNNADAPPVIQCPGNIVVTVAPGECSSAPVTFTATASDDRPGVTIACVPPSGSIFPGGITTVVCTATDSAGQTASCGFTVTVTDNQPPTAVCRDISVNLTAAGGTVTITPQDVDGGSSDNCAIVEWTLDRNTFSCCDVGTNFVILTVKDAAGLSDSCVAMVVVTVDTVTVDQNSTINFNTIPPSYTGDPDLLPFLTYDKTGGATADKWKVIINVGPRKLLIKNGATITTTTVPATSNNRRAPGIVILACQEEIEAGGAVVVTSVNQPAGDIVIQTTGQNVINGTVRNEVQGTLGRPGAISISSCCHDIVTGPASRIETIGVDPGGNNINLLTCEPGGDIFLTGLVRAIHKMGITPTINISSFAGTITIDGNNDFGEETINGGLVRTMSGVQVRTVNAMLAGNIRMQAQGDITVLGNRILNRNRTQYGAVAIKSHNSNGQGGSGLMDVRSIAGNIIASDRAFDFENRFNGLNQIQLLAAGNIVLAVTPLINDGAADNTKAVVSTQGGSAGKGGVNTLGAYSGSIVVGVKAQVLANFTGTPGQVGSNLFGSCTGNLILGVVNPAPTFSILCSPPAPAPLFNDCADFGLICP